MEPSPFPLPLAPNRLVGEAGERHRYRADGRDGEVAGGVRGSERRALGTRDQALDKFTARHCARDDACSSCSRLDDQVTRQRTISISTIYANCGRQRLHVRYESFWIINEKYYSFAIYNVFVHLDIIV